MNTHKFGRIRSIDTVRGLVMILMALDHIRDLYHVTSLTHDPLDLATTTPALFFTRWITHLCAPTFVFLAGTSACLGQKKERGQSHRSFLISRGIWLVLLEFTVVNFGIWFDIHFNVFLFQVIAAIGFGFILLGIFHRAKPAFMGLLGLFILFTYNALPALPPLFGPTALPLAGKILVVGYPPVPWIAILFAGYGFGGLLMGQAAPARRRLFLYTGCLALSLFGLLRLLNVYGDPAPWHVQDRGWLFTAFSFLNVAKYPPSLLYCLLMLGIMFLFLVLAEYMEGTLKGRISLYGKVPLFYYVLHWYIIHTLLFVVLLLQGFGPEDFRFGFSFGRPAAESGLPLWGVYLLWIAVVAMLYPLCKWYADYKAHHPNQAWLRYL